MRNRKGYKAIKAAMRANEVSLLAHLRKHRVTHMMGFGMAWTNAMDRLLDGGMVTYVREYTRQGRQAYGAHYVARKGARPVTAAVR